MPTNKQRFTTTLPDGLYDELLDYQFAHRYTSTSKAVVNLLRKGLFASGSLPSEESTAEARLLYLFGQLNDQGRELLIEAADTMVRSRKYK